MRRALKNISIILSLIIFASGALYISFPNEVRTIITVLTQSYDSLVERQEEHKQELQDSFAQIGLDLNEIEESTANKPYEPPWDIDVKTGDVTWHIDPETGKIPLPVNPVTGKVTLPINPISGTVVMPVDPHTGQSLLPTNPETGETLLPTDPETGEILLPINPETGESEQRVDANTGEILPEHNSDQDSSDPGKEKIEAIMAQFYQLESSFVGQLEALPSSASAEFHALPKEEWTQANKVRIARKYVSTAGKLEQKCDLSVYRLTEQLRTTLKEYGKDPALADQVMQYYMDAKASKKSAFLNKYSEYIN